MKRVQRRCAMRHTHLTDQQTQQCSRRWHFAISHSDWVIVPNFPVWFGMNWIQAQKPRIVHILRHDLDFVLLSATLDKGKPPIILCPNAHAWKSHEVFYNVPFLNSLHCLGHKLALLRREKMRVRMPFKDSKSCRPTLSCIANVMVTAEAVKQVICHVITYWLNTRDLCKVALPKVLHDWSAYVRLYKSIYTDIVMDYLPLSSLEKSQRHFSTWSPSNGPVKPDFIHLS